MPSITFFFNQLMTPEMCTGGDIRGKIIADFFKKETEYKVKILLPKIGEKEFKHRKIIIGNSIFEKIFSKPIPFSAFILFWCRTIESIIKFKKIKSDFFYLTGDFFCNTIPAYIIKKRYSDTKIIVCIHHINENPFKRKSNYFITSFVSYLLQRFSFYIIKNHSDIIFTVNSQVKKYLENHNFNQNIFITGNGLDIKTIKKELSKLHQKPLNHICYFGRVSPTKGSFDLPIILSILLKNIPNLHLDIVGIATPEIIPKLNAKFEKYHCQNHYTIHNYIKEKSDIYKIILNSKVSIFPSYEEGWGISLFESIMCRRPLVAYDLPVYKEIFENKLITVAIGNTQQMAQKVSYFLKNYQNNYTKKYIDECNRIAQKYDWNNVFLQEKKSINNLLKK